MVAIAEPKVIFREIQRFRRPTIALVLLAVSLMVAGLTLAIAWKAFGGPGAPPREGVHAVLAMCGMGVLMAAIMASIWWAKLITEVREDGLFVRFVPFHFKYRRIPLENLTSLEATTYRPILDYGGWGIRYGWKGMAYNVSGNRGVNMKFRQGRDILIGSQRPEELAMAISSALRHGGPRG